MKNEQKWLIFSNFALKIMALLFMTLDHVGLQISYYFLDSGSPIVLISRGLGRLAVPLFAFLIYEGVTHTKNFKKYALRLGFMAFLISGAFALMIYIPNPFMSGGLMDGGNIFIDLLLGAIGVFLLKNKNVKIKLLSLLP
ncbi:MAG TPA: TraX family protein, partial [Bacilli bacterium]|nr:TraX family protein [Bacilli bacterium]